MAKMGTDRSIIFVTQFAMRHTFRPAPSLVGRIIVSFLKDSRLNYILPRCFCCAILFVVTIIPRIFKEEIPKGSASSMAHTDPDNSNNPSRPADADSMTNAITMYTTTWCGDCRRAKRVFADFGVPYVEVDIGADDEAAELVQTLNNGLRSVPTILFPDGSILVEPSNVALMAKLQPYTVAAH